MKLDRKGRFKYEAGQPLFRWLSGFLFPQPPYPQSQLSQRALLSLQPSALFRLIRSGCFRLRRTAHRAAASFAHLCQLPLDHGNKTLDDVKNRHSVSFPATMASHQIIVRARADDGTQSYC